MGTVRQPDILRQTIIINDDYVRKYCHSDGRVLLNFGSADTNHKRIIVNNFIIDKNITLLNSTEIENLKQRINNVNAEMIVAHELQHIHNNALGYNYIANSNNIYECMLLALVDELSAMIAGHLKKTEDVDLVIDELIDNMPKNVRQGYIKGQFTNHFVNLQKTLGKYKNLYEYKYDSKKINRLIEYYFTINGKNFLHQKVNKSTKIKFDAFLLQIRKETRDYIENYIRSMGCNDTKDLL